MVDAVIVDLPTLSTPDLNHEEESLPLVQKTSHCMQKTQEILSGKALDNSSQTLFYTLSVVGNTNYGAGIMSPSDNPADLSHGPACFEAANATLGAASIVACYFLAKEGLEAADQKDACETAIIDLESNLDDLAPLEKYDVQHKIGKLKESCQTLASKIHLAVANFFNMSIQVVLSALSLVGDFLDPDNLLNPSPGDSLSPLGHAIVWMGLISAGIGIVLGLYYLMRTLSRMEDNRSALEDVGKQIEEIERLQQENPDLKDLLEVEKLLLGFEKEKLENEWTHLKTSLISNTTLFLGSILGFALNILSGGGFMLISWITVGVMTASGISSGFHKIYLRREMNETQTRYQEKLQGYLEMTPMPQKPIPAAVTNHFCAKTPHAEELLTKDPNLLPYLILKRVQHEFPLIPRPEPVAQTA